STLAFNISRSSQTSLNNRSVIGNPNASVRNHFQERTRVSRGISNLKRKAELPPASNGIKIRKLSGIVSDYRQDRGACRPLIRVPPRPFNKSESVFCASLLSYQLLGNVDLVSYLLGA